MRYVDEFRDPDAARALLSVLEGAAVTSWRVSPAVNSVRNNGPELLDPA